MPSRYVKLIEETIDTSTAHVVVVSSGLPHTGSLYNPIFWYV